MPYTTLCQSPIQHCVKIDLDSTDKNLPAVSELTTEPEAWRSCSCKSALVMAVSNLSGCVRSTVQSRVVMKVSGLMGHSKQSMDAHALSSRNQPALCQISLSQPPADSSLQPTASNERRLGWSDREASVLGDAYCSGSARQLLQCNTWWPTDDWTGCRSLCLPTCLSKSGNYASALSTYKLRCRWRRRDDVQYTLY